MTKTAYLAFLSESPMVGLDPHPSWSPQPVITSFDAKGYAEALGAYDDHAELVKDVTEDHQARLDAVEEGDLEDADESDDICEICIHDDGRIDIIDIKSRMIFRTYTIREVYEAFGMEMPSPTAS